MLTVDRLSKTFGGPANKRRGRLVSRTAQGDQAAVESVSFEVHEAELFTFLGPSGCGKTTTLRMIAGLEQPDSGTIAINEHVMFDKKKGINVPANQRQLGMVFQSYAIWPHMTVYENVAFPLEARSRDHKFGRAEIRARVGEVLKKMELDPWTHGNATKLSGGQQQRLALARSLVSRPRLLLLDEPLSNLDAKLRESMRLELRALQQELGLTALYVTHDQGEALAMSNRIAVMDKGRILQVGTPNEIYEEPNSAFVASFVGSTNLIPGKVITCIGSECSLEIDRSFRLVARSEECIPNGRDVRVSIRPEDLVLSQPPYSGNEPNTLNGTVLTKTYGGDVVHLVVGVGTMKLNVRSAPSTPVAIGDEVKVTVSIGRVRLFATTEPYG